MPIFEYACSNCGHVFEKLVLTHNQEPPECPKMRLEAGRAEVLGICHRRHPKQVSRRRVCAYRWRLTALIGEQSASF
jgi:putative FmdB family regulatory protein